jgi:hypothetical protein
MNKSGLYTRDLSKKEIQSLQRKYTGYLKRSRQGFLSNNNKMILLKYKKWGEGTDSDDIYRFFYEIREKAFTAFSDLMLLCDTLSEDQIKEIFNIEPNISNKEPRVFGNEEDYQSFQRQHPVFNNIVENVLKDRSPITLKTIRKKSDYDLILDDSWQAFLAYGLIDMCLKFFSEHGFLSSKAHERLADEVKDMLNVEIARGIKLKRYERVKGFV